MKHHKNIAWIIAAAVVVTLVAFLISTLTRTMEKPVPGVLDNTQTKFMRLESLDFKANQLIPAKFTCDGQNIHPTLIIGDVPAKAASLAIVVEDLDAGATPRVHWLLWNINPYTRQIFENTVPDGAVAGKNSSGTMQYQGPCPPSGEHQYRFTLYALDEALTLAAGADKAAFEAAASGHILDQVTLTGVYSRSN